MRKPRPSVNNAPPSQTLELSGSCTHFLLAVESSYVMSELGKVGGTLAKLEKAVDRAPDSQVDLFKSKMTGFLQGARILHKKGSGFVSPPRSCTLLSHLFSSQSIFCC